MAGKCCANLERDAREDQLLAAARGDGLSDLGIIERVDRRAIDDNGR
jgi:hypothetical protein